MPDDFDVECWTEVLRGYTQPQILEALKQYRLNTEYNIPPNPAGLKRYLASTVKIEDDGNTRAKIIRCMQQLYDKYGISGAQHYHEALLSDYGVPYPANEEVWQKIIGA